MRLRIRDLARVLVTIAAEMVLVVTLWVAAPVMGSVDFSHLGVWVQHTEPSTAVTAVARLAGLAFAVWLLASTLVYLGASVAGADGLVRRSGWVTLPLVRRMVDGLAAASILASAMSVSGGGSALAASAHSRAVVQPLTPPRNLDDGHRSPPVVVRAHESSGSRVAVGERPVGRHLPHPGVLDHPELAVSQVATPAVPQAGAPQNRFGGLSPGTKVVVVRPGDCLSVIAENHLGDWRSTPKSTPSTSGDPSRTAGRSATITGFTRDGCW